MNRPTSVCLPLLKRKRAYAIIFAFASEIASFARAEGARLLLCTAFFCSIYERRVRMNTCYIIAAGECGKIEFERDESDFVICADAGYRKALKNDIKPDLVVGDFDSLGKIPQLENVEVHPVVKDETDTFFALCRGLERGYKSFTIFGALGGRLDHTVANLQLLKFLCERGAQCVLISERETVTAVMNGSITFPQGETGVVSVFSLSDSSHGVTERGFKYELDNAELTSSFPLGVSNELTGEGAEISVKDGVLLIIREMEV